MSNNNDIYPGELCLPLWQIPFMSLFSVLKGKQAKRGCKIYAICKSIMLIPFWDYFALNLTSPGGMQKAWNQECKLFERDSNVVSHYSFCFSSKILPGQLVLIFLHFSRYMFHLLIRKCFNNISINADIFSWIHQAGPNNIFYWVQSDRDPQCNADQLNVMPTRNMMP